MKTIILSSLVLPLLSFAAKTSSWSQWRGPDRNGMISKDSAWPSKIDKETLTEKWRVSLGKGYSGPVVSENLVFTTESVDEYELAYAYNRNDGKLLWQTQWEGKMKVPFFAAKMGVGYAQHPHSTGTICLFVVCVMFYTPLMQRQVK